VPDRIVGAAPPAHRAVHGPLIDDWVPAAPVEHAHPVGDLPPPVGAALEPVDVSQRGHEIV
jgi:hypothetical protein